MTGGTAGARAFAAAAETPALWRRARNLKSLCTAGLALGLSVTACVLPAEADSGLTRFNCVPNRDQFSIWTVPAGVSEVTVNLVGAAGGAYRGRTGLAGKGANMTITVEVQAGDQLWAQAGCAGSRSTPYGFGRGGARGDSYWAFDGARGGGGSVVGFYTPTRTSVIAVAGGGGAAGGGDNHGIGGGNGGNAGAATGGAPWALAGTAGTGGGGGHAGAAACEATPNGGAGDSQGFISSFGAGGGGGGGGYSPTGGGGCGGGHGTTQRAAAGGGGGGASYIDTAKAELAQIVPTSTGDGQVNLIYEIIP